MADSKTAKLPEILKDAKEKAAEKAKAKAKKPKAKAKAKTPGKRSAAVLDEIEEFAAEMTDVHGNQRLTYFGDDILNAINYTLEKVPLRDRLNSHVTNALDLSVLFGLEGSLESAGIERATAWTRARQQIKSILTRAHALKARVSDPDQLLESVEKPAADEPKSDSDSGTFQSLAAILRAVNDKAFAAFFDSNFNFQDDDGAQSDKEISGVEIPTLASVIDEQPGIKLVINKVKKIVRTKATSPSTFEGSEEETKTRLLTDIISEVAKTVNSIFDPSLVDLAISLISASTAVGQDFYQMHLDLIGS